MGYYDVAQICLNGHCITGAARTCPSDRQNFCDKCGAATIMECPECHADIRGEYQADGLFNFAAFPVPAYCSNCGKPYPWTKSAMEAVAELIQEDEDMQEAAKEALVASLPDVIAETPRTNLAATRVRKALLAAGRFTADGLRQFAIDFGCELVKQQLNL